MGGNPCPEGLAAGTPIQSVIYRQSQGQHDLQPETVPPPLYFFYLLVLHFCLQVLVPVSFLRHQISLKEGPFSCARSGKDKGKMIYPPKVLLLWLRGLQFCLQMPVLVFLARYQVPLHQSNCLL